MNFDEFIAALKARRPEWFAAKRTKQAPGACGGKEGPGGREDGKRATDPSETPRRGCSRRRVGCR